MSERNQILQELNASGVVIGRLRRDLGTLESYAALIGILIGAGIFKVTSQAWSLTGPSVILGYVVLMPAILATSIPYAAFLSTPLGREPGGEYAHISRTLGGFRIAYIGAWLKIISYVGAGAYLSSALADYLIELFGKSWNSSAAHLGLAMAGLTFFYAVHVAGVRWFGRIQVTMCVALGISLVVLIVPGLFAIRPANYSPFVTHGLSGFGASLMPLFFSYAGFESLAQTAGEVKDSTKRLPLVFLRGISVTALIFVLMSIVSFGVLPGSRLQNSGAPMAEVAAVYLPYGTAWIITVGAIMAIMTSLNASLIVPSRLAIIFARDGLARPWVGYINGSTGTPIRALTLTFAACAVLLISNQMSLALNIAVFALVLLYFMHTLIFMLLPKWNPTLLAAITINLPHSVRVLAGVVSLFSMGLLIVLQFVQDVQQILHSTLRERLDHKSLTSAELALAWSVVGIALFVYARWRGKQDRIDPETRFDITSPDLS